MKGRKGGRRKLGGFFRKIKPVGRLNVELLEYCHMRAGGFYISFPVFHSDKILLTEEGNTEGTDEQKKKKQATKRNFRRTKR
jgi:hypothetical protein